GALCPPVAHGESGVVAGGNPPWGPPDFPCTSRLLPGQGDRPLVLGQVFLGKKVGIALRGDERGGAAS
ncbi:MAG TPA: hypothetical protein VED66_04235, partial [Candidatus Sulfotelmatobacter sp.]|nr:hypothetical protein [Candidatus Sulfotelmatobacter sp.]